MVRRYSPAILPEGPEGRPDSDPYISPRSSRKLIAGVNLPQTCIRDRCSIREEIPKNQQKRPVALMIPVNLRNYFPSQSMTNFFGWIEVGYIFSDETTFEDVLDVYKRQI